ncbi:MAG: LPS export ABC transporter permease LptF [Acidiferrobacterales bacterium]
MIISRAFFKEAVFVTVAVMVVLLTLFVLQGAGGVFSQTKNGGQGIGRSLLALIVLFPLVNFGLLLILAMFIGLLVTLSRWYRDSEIVVLQACGIGTLALLRPVMRFALVFFVVVAVEGFFMRPWVMTSIDRIQAVSSSSNSTAWISSGTFNEIQGRVGIFYAETVSDDGTMRNVFLNQAAKGNSSERVTVAKTARRARATPDSDEYLELVEGSSWRGNAGTADYQITRFEKYRIRIKPANIIQRHRDVQALSTLELLKQDKPENVVEFHMRLSKPIVVFILAALALALSHSDPRRSRYYNLFIAIFLFFVYMQLLLVAETLVRRGQVPAALGLWWVHAIFAAMAGYFLWRRSRGEPLISIPHWKRIKNV